MLYILIARVFNYSGIEHGFWNETRITQRLWYCSPNHLTLKPLRSPLSHPMYGYVIWNTTDRHKPGMAVSPLFPSGELYVGACLLPGTTLQGGLGLTLKLGGRPRTARNGLLILPDPAQVSSSCCSRGLLPVWGSSTLGSLPLRKGRQRRRWLHGITDSMDMSLSKL